MKKLKKAVIITIIILLSIFGFTRFTSEGYTYIPKGEVSKAENQTAFNLLNELLDENGLKKYTFIDYLNEHQNQFKYNLDNFSVSLTSYDEIDSDLNKPKKNISEGDSGVYSVNIFEAGYYNIELDYLVEEATLNDIIISIKINDNTYYSEMDSIIIPILWNDETKDYSVDRYGDEVLSNQLLVGGWKHTALYSSTYQSVDSLVFYLEEGVNDIKLENITSTPLVISNIEILSLKSYLSYSAYIEAFKDIQTKALIEVEATDYIVKNSSYIQSFALSNPSAKPFDPVNKKLNIIDGNTWNQSGQSLTYEFHVEDTGLYQIAFKYINDKSDFNVLRSIAIDGEIPFEEFREYEFPTTSPSTLKIHTLSSEDEPYFVYLKKGHHTMTIKAETESLQKSLRDIQQLIDHINAFSLEVRKITGKTVDQNRTWKFTQYIPETPEYLEAYQTMLKHVITNLSQFASNGYRSSTLSGLQKALFKIENIYKDYDRLPFYLEDLIGGAGSVSQYLGNAITSIGTQPLYLDGIYLHNDSKLPKENVGFIKRALSSFQTFLSSFTSSKYRQTSNENVVEVWVNRPITYVDMMQKMVDKDFTNETGIRVKISVMTDPNKLIMSAAAKQQPDVALGLASYMPYDLAIRNAAYDLSSFPDYYEFASQFSPGAFIPYILNEKAYALPETLDFNVLMYRKDIFNSLGFLVPDTWDEVIQILPELQQYGMNFYHPIAGGGGSKYFYQTSGFLYQFGGSLYNTSGLEASIDTKESIEGLKFLNQLFTNYSLPEQVQSFYNGFRYSTLPIGISDFQNYLLIKNAAPELVGQWEIAPYPSITRNDGNINRYYIANGTAGMVLNGTDKAEQSWSFLKWWLGEKTQTQFAFNIQSTYGPTYAWLSANIEAVKNAPLPEKDKAVILEQVKWLIDVPRTPGQYMLERSLSNIWNAVVFEGFSTGVAVDKNTILINREIRKKMIEFGFIDQDGSVIKGYTIPTIEWIQNKIDESAGGAHGSDN